MSERVKKYKYKYKIPIEHDEILYPTESEAHDILVSYLEKIATSKTHYIARHDIIVDLKIFPITLGKVLRIVSEESLMENSQLKFTLKRWNYKQSNVYYALKLKN